MKDGETTLKVAEFSKNAVEITLEAVEITKNAVEITVKWR